MATLEAGLFFFIFGIAMLGFVLIRQVIDFQIISMVLFLALSLMLFSGYDIVVTKATAESVEVETTYNSTGHLITNSTRIIPASEEQTSVITGMHMALGWTFFAMAMISTFLWLKLGLFNR